MFDRMGNCRTSAKEHNAKSKIVIIDSGCSRSIVSAKSFRLWSRKHVDVETIDNIIRAYCVVGTVNICTDNSNSVKVDILVAHDKPLSFDLLDGIDAITA